MKNMMKKILICSLLLFSSVVLADSEKNQKIKTKIDKHKPNAHSIIDVIPLNSPVKESVARFLIKTPEKFDIDEVFYQVKNSGRIFEKPRVFQKTKLIESPQGKELHVNVSKLPPGFYQLLVKIKDRSKREHIFKTKYKDHAMFMIDDSLEVPMPDSKKNNATVAGVDSDNDGIRDDVQRWINEEFSSQPKVKAAMRQVAMGRQNDLLSASEKEKSIEASQRYLNDLSCLLSVVGVHEKSKLNRQLNEKMLNTKDRLYADMKANANFSGQAWVSPGQGEGARAMCNFPFNF